MTPEIIILMVLLVHVFLVDVSLIYMWIRIRKRGPGWILNRMVEKLKIGPETVEDLLYDFVDKHGGEIAETLSGWLKSNFLNAVQQDKKYTGKLAEWMLSTSHPLIGYFLDAVPEARSYIRKHPDMAVWVAMKFAPMLMNLPGMGSLEAENVGRSAENLYRGGDILSPR